MYFYLVFTIVFMIMLLVVLVQARRQAGLSWRAFGLFVVGGLGLSAMLTSTRVIPHSWSMPAASVAWWLGYSLFGLVAYLFLFHVLLLLVEGGAKLALPDKAPALRSRRTFFGVAAMAIGTVAWGMREATELRVLTRRMVSPKLLRPLRAVVVTDVHLGALTVASRLDELRTLVQAQKPDVVFLVGDMVNDHLDEIRPLAEKLKPMRGPLGMFGVFGNHERYEGDAASARVFQWLGAELLRNRSVVLPGTGVEVLGVDDPGRGAGMTQMIAGEIRGVAAGSDPNNFRILLNHRPEAWREAAKPEGIELMLSGHTHRGQLFPFNYVVRLTSEFVGGFYEEDGKVLAVSAGAGFWGPPMRVFAPPDILVLDFVPGGPQGG